MLRGKREGGSVLLEIGVFSVCTIGLQVKQAEYEALFFQLAMTLLW